MQNRVVTVVWVVGLVLAALVYALGPDDTLASVFAFAEAVGDTVQRAIAELGGRAFDVLRALAIGCFAVFVVLSIVAAGRGLAGQWLMLWVSLGFLLLVWRQGPEATAHWVLAFTLAACAALNATRRLTERAYP